MADEPPFISTYVCACVWCGEHGLCERRFYEVARDRWLCDACLAAVMEDSDAE